jgi:hypothetical protein
MPFFLIVPAWILCVLAGIGLLCFRKFSGVGIYVIGISTAATVASSLLSTAVLFVAPRLGLQHMGRWAGIVVIIPYVISIGVGAVIGGVAGFFAVRKLMRLRSPLSV